MYGIHFDHQNTAKVKEVSEAKLQLMFNNRNYDFKFCRKADAMKWGKKGGDFRQPIDSAVFERQLAAFCALICNSSFSKVHASCFRCNAMLISGIETSFV